MSTGKTSPTAPDRGLTPLPTYCRPSGFLHLKAPWWVYEEEFEIKPRALKHSGFGTEVSFWPTKRYKTFSFFLMGLMLRHMRRRIRQPFRFL